MPKPQSISTVIGHCSMTEGTVRVNWLEADRDVAQRLVMQHPFRYFNNSPEVIRLAVMMHIRYRLSLRQVEDLLFERGIDICHETVRFWWNRFGEFPPAVPATRGCDGEIHGHQNPEEIRRRAGRTTPACGLRSPPSGFL
jgi:hypothetical protein